MNPYLAAKRDQYNAIEASVSGLQTRAAAEARDLTEDELRSVEGQIAAGKKLYSEIEMLTAQENRSLSVADMTSKLVTAKASGFAVSDRDPGLYRSASSGGANSWFGDLYRATILHDQSAQARMSEHDSFMRAHQTTSTSAGNVPPEWMTSEFTTLAQQGRKIAAAVRNIPIQDARAFSLPGQTASTTVGASDTENTAITPGDAYTSAAVTVTPDTIVGSEVISRQLLDASNPAIDSMILADLTLSYNTKVETLVATKIVGIGSALTGVTADFIDPTATNFAYNQAVLAALDVYKARFQRADAFVCDFGMYQLLLGLLDSNGRPLFAGNNAYPMNVLGQGGAGAMDTDGWFAGMPLIVSSGMGGADVGYGAAIIKNDVCVFEKGAALFSFQEVLGPQSIVLSLWGYVATAVRQGTRSVKNVTVTAS